MAPVPLSELAGYLDGYLRIAEVPDEANAVNGLQVENGSGTVERLIAAVDASLATIAGTASAGGRCLLLVHHGLFWDGSLPVTGRRYRRLRALLDHDVALYAAHIPLDVHPVVGNNAVLANALGLADQQPFDSYRGVPIGVQGRLHPPAPRDELAARLKELLSTTVRVIPGGPDRSDRIGIITGAGGNRIAAARAAGLDTYLTGEGAHHTYFDAMEFGINVMYAGHYATETVGVKALAAHLGQRFDLPWEFHPHPTGL
jgi:dinuclear metal center YbgI/SA1388 family protein